MQIKGINGTYKLYKKVNEKSYSNDLIAPSQIGPTWKILVYIVSNVLKLPYVVLNTFLWTHKTIKKCNIKTKEH